MMVESSGAVAVESERSGVDLDLDLVLCSLLFPFRPCNQHASNTRLEKFGNRARGQNNDCDDDCCGLS